MPRPDLFSLAKTFLWQNARLLERQLFRFHFQNGSRQSVLAALVAYQNPDGGFGNALEPDIRCPESQPVPTELALTLLDAVGFENEVGAPVTAFVTGVATEEGGIPFVLPSVRAYPRAPWWNTDDNPSASINPTAGIVGILLKHGVAPPAIDRAAAYCWSVIESYETPEPHEILSILRFLEAVPDRDRAAKAFAPIGEKILASGMVALDPDAEGYVQKPLDFAPTPQSICYPLFSSSVIERHLDALENRQEEDGSWNLFWEAISPTVAQEWRGILTLNALKTLRAYGRI